MQTHPITSAPINASAEAEPTNYHYCIVRGDIPAGHKAAQLVHAAGESSKGLASRGTHAVALQAKDELHLFRIRDILIREGVEFVSILEPDAPYCGQLMAIGIVPHRDRSRSKYATSGLPLVK